MHGRGEEGDPEMSDPNGTNGTSIRRLLRDAVADALASLPLHTKLWALSRLRRPILWTLFRLETAPMTLTSAGPNPCRYRMWVNWQDSTEMVLGVYEPWVVETLRRELRPGDFCIDVGAHIGYHALLMSKLVGPEGLVVAFEPFPRCFSVLLENAVLNDASNLRAKNMALSERTETLRLAFSADEELTMTPSVAAYAVKGPDASIEVPALSLDGYLDELGRTPALIQIDVEGAEISVLRGAAGTLRRARPKLLIEVHGWETAAREEVSGFLSRFGYSGNVVGRRGDQGFVLFH
ncbi:MAG: FkbM family methyltransferase [Terriglobia bacterium]|jgi:FkbM family methyltransferase